MKRLLSVMIGLGLLLGVTAFAQAQEPQKTEKKKKKKGGKKGSKKKQEEKKPA